MKLVGLAARNLSRNRRRSAITLSAIAVGVAAVVTLRGLSEGFVAMMIAEVVGGRTAAIQVHRAGYFEDLEVLPTGLNMPYDAATIGRLAAVPGVAGVSGRIRFGGLISNGASEATFIGRGVDPEREREACPQFGNDVTAGAALARGDEGSAVLGAELARALGASPKDDSYLALSATSPEGRANALGVAVKGVASLRLPFENKRSVVVPLRLAQELLGLDGRVTEYALAVRDEAQLDQTAAALRAELGPDYEVHTWRELEPYVRDVIRRQRFVLGVVGAILIVIVLTGIANTMLMSVHERVREIGTLLAMGMRRRQIVSMFLLEAGLLGLFGGAAGASIGAATVLTLGAVGIRLRVLDVAVVLRPQVQPWFIAAAVAVAAAGAAFAALLPSRRAARLDPVQALRDA